MTATEAITRPTVGAVEQRGADAAALTDDGARLSGFIPYGVESRDLGGWREVIERGALDDADTSELLAVVEHDDGRVLGRFPGTLALSDEPGGMRWSVTLPPTREAAEIRALVERGDLRATSWRMRVARDRWEGQVRHVEAIAELLDVSIVSRAAYGDDAAVELRAYVPASKEGRMPVETEAVETVENENTTETAAERVEQRSTPPTGGLRVESRNVTDDSAGAIERRMAEAARSVPRGESRSLTAASAGALLPEHLDRHVWDRLRARSVFLQTGVQVLTTGAAEVRLPRITADATAKFTAQATAIDASDPTLSELVVTPKSLKSYVLAASEVVDDSDPSVLQVVQDHLIEVHAGRLDQEFINGAATSNPNGFAGLLNVAGIGALDGSGMGLWEAVTTAAGALRAAGAQKVVALVHPWSAMAADLARDDSGATSGTGGWLARPASLPAIHESARLPVASDAAPALVFDPTKVVVVRRQDTVLDIDRSQEFQTDQVAIRGRTRAALGVPHPGAVIKVTGLDAVDPMA